MKCLGSSSITFNQTTCEIEATCITEKIVFTAVTSWYKVNWHFARRESSIRESANVLRAFLKHVSLDYQRLHLISHLLCSIMLLGVQLDGRISCCWQLLLISIFISYISWPNERDGSNLKLFCTGGNSLKILIVEPAWTAYFVLYGSCENWKHTS